MPLETKTLAKGTMRMSKTDLTDDDGHETCTLPCLNELAHIQQTFMTIDARQGHEFHRHPQ